MNGVRLSAGDGLSAAGPGDLEISVDSEITADTTAEFLTFDLS